MAEKIEAYRASLIQVGSLREWYTNVILPWPSPWDPMGVLAPLSFKVFFSGF